MTLKIEDSFTGFVDLVSWFMLFYKMNISMLTNK